MGRPFVSASSSYVVTNYHIELLQMIIALKLANLNVLNYSLTFDNSYSLLKLDVTDYSTNYYFIFGSLQRAFTNRSRAGLSSQRDGSLS